MADRKQRLILHIGTHKTGTTAFQELLREYARELERRDRIRPIWLQRGFAVQSFMRLREYDAAAVEELRLFLQRHARRDGISVVSCEYLSGDRDTMYANRGVIAQMLADATREFRVEVCVFFRRQDEFIQSMFAQRTHRGERVDEDVETFARAFDWQLLDWNEFLVPYIEGFGAENVHVYPYDPQLLLRQPVVALLNGRLRSTVLAPVREPTVANVGFGPAALAIANRLNPGLGAQGRRVLRDALHAVGSKGVLVEYNLLRPETKRELVEFFRPANRRLAARYFAAEYGVEDFSPPSFEAAEVDVEAQLYEVVRHLVEQVESRSYLSRNRVVRTLQAVRALLAP